MNTGILAHRFFHEPESRGEYTNVNTHFTYKDWRGNLCWQYYSYNTPVAEIKTDKRGVNILIVSHHRYSTFTARHISELLRANPGLPVLEVPRVSSGYYYSISGKYDFKHVLDYIEDMKEKDMNHMEERQYVMDTLNMFDAYVKLFDDMDKRLIRQRKHVKFARLMAIIEEKERALNERRKVWAERKAIREEEKRKKEEALIAQLLEQYKEGDRLAQIQLLFSRYWYEGEMHDYRRALENARDEKGRFLSYVWIDGNKAKTSRQCEAPIDDVKRLLGMWKHRQSMIGQRAGIYTVVENDTDHVKIGCHVIPAWNIELLCDKLNVA